MLIVFLLSLLIVMLGKGVVDVSVLHEAAKLVIGRPGARAVQTSAGNKDLKDDQEV